MRSLGAPTDLVALQAEVARAGRAWACPYSSAAEFEAAVIRSRRRSGAFSAMRWRYVLYAGTAAGVLAVLAFLY
jgi:hypothetical protein